MLDEQQWQLEWPCDDFSTSKIDRDEEEKEDLRATSNTEGYNNMNVSQFTVLHYDVVSW